MKHKRRRSPGKPRGPRRCSNGSIRMPRASIAGRRRTMSPCRRIATRAGAAVPDVHDDLHRLADWLAACRVKSVAMEATGVYWIPIYEILEARGFEVLLVNARHLKNVPGRKSDVSDCQWLRELHSVGLLRGSFRPPAAWWRCAPICAIGRRSSRAPGIYIQRMQKALVQMNLQLPLVVSDITGVPACGSCGTSLPGHRDPQHLAHIATTGAAPPRPRSWRRSPATIGPSTSSSCSRIWNSSTPVRPARAAAMSPIEATSAR